MITKSPKTLGYCGQRRGFLARHWS